ncbi:hypothetical protein F441_04245 [Phytophthora nicotianae CJ01A1]|uniref:Uncharacterized protein n=2 Tax=Phytophthora nicotianae TaxID=4792 RepID=W2XKC2_PHYNI|nr:hypothetical protein L915_04154 [Phytophthora nicotianae]ETP22394.1 hypothetical protein F441_04245 [Phytophthora nicotianae CJ01A1]
MPITGDFRQNLLIAIRTISFVPGICKIQHLQRDDLLFSDPLEMPTTAAGLENSYRIRGCNSVQYSTEALPGYGG